MALISSKSGTLTFGGGAMEIKDSEYTTQVRIHETTRSGSGSDAQFEAGTIAHMVRCTGFLAAANPQGVTSATDIDNHEVTITLNYAGGGQYSGTAIGTIRTIVSSDSGAPIGMTFSGVFKTKPTYTAP